MLEPGLESRELSALTLIAEHDGRTGDWLRIRIDLSQSGTVRLVDRLVSRELVHRGRAGGRALPLHVTPEGAAVLAAWAQGRDDVATDLLVAVSPASRGEVVAGMAAALQGRERFRPEADATCRRCTCTACGDDCLVDRSVAGKAEPL